MIEIRKTDFFVNWLDMLSDNGARARILVRIERLAMGNPGDAKPLGIGVCELTMAQLIGFITKKWVIK